MQSSKTSLKQVHTNEQLNVNQVYIAFNTYFKYKSMGSCLNFSTSSRQRNYKENNKCLVYGCEENHSHHYCRCCKDKDSSHFSHDCSMRSLNCLVPGCKQGHSQHYCTICRNKNSDHFARDCNQGMLVYHGTSLNSYQNIKNEGFKPSKDGNLGAGVYFTNDNDAAKGIAQNRALQRSSTAVVIECRIPKDQKTVQQRFHDKWENVTQTGFQEYAVKDPKRIKIVRIQEQK